MFNLAIHGHGRRYNYNCLALLTFPVALLGLGVNGTMVQCVNSENCAAVAASAVALLLIFASAWSFSLCTFAPKLTPRFIAFTLSTDSPLLPSVFDRPEKSVHSYNVFKDPAFSSIISYHHTTFKTMLSCTKAQRHLRETLYSNCDSENRVLVAGIRSMEQK